MQKSLDIQKKKKAVWGSQISAKSKMEQKNFLLKIRFLSMVRLKKLKLYFQKVVKLLRFCLGSFLIFSYTHKKKVKEFFITHFWGIYIFWNILNTIWLILKNAHLRVAQILQLL